jgi:hypothetical protein
VTVGIALAAAGGLVWLLGAAIAEWVEGLGAMLAWVGAVIAGVGLVLLVASAVAHRIARHRPFA